MLCHIDSKLSTRIRLAVFCLKELLCKIPLYLCLQESVQLLWNRKSSLSQAPRVGSGSAGQNGYRHILTPIGCTWDGNSPMVIYPHPSGQGNLKQYLTKFATGLATF